jgi:hypothetical protein
LGGVGEALANGLHERHADGAGQSAPSNYSIHSFLHSFPDLMFLNE